MKILPPTRRGPDHVLIHADPRAKGGGDDVQTGGTARSVSRCTDKPWRPWASCTDGSVLLLLQYTEVGPFSTFNMALPTHA